MQIAKFSPSALGTLDHCEWQYVLKYGMKFDDPSGPSAFVGSLAHKFLEILAAYKLNGEVEYTDNDSKIMINSMVPLDELWEKCCKYFEGKDLELWTKINDAGNKVATVKKGVWRLLETANSPLKNNVVKSEYRFSVDLDGPEWVTKLKEDGSPEYLFLNGVIDRVDKVGPDAYNIIDYKSGKSTKFPTSKQQELEDFYDNFQCLIYYLAARSLYPDANSITVTFIYFCENKVFSVALSDYDIETLKTKVLKKFNRVKTMDDPSRNKGFWCKHICSLGKRGICDKVWEEKDVYGLENLMVLYQNINKKEVKLENIATAV